MVKFDDLTLSFDILKKLKSKNIESLTRAEYQVYNAVLNGQNVAADYSIRPESYIAPLLMKLKNNISFEEYRKPRLMVILKREKECDQLNSILKSLLPKEFVIYIIRNIKAKKIMDDLNDSIDVIIGTLSETSKVISRVLIDSDLRHVLIYDFHRHKYDSLLFLANSILNDAKNVQIIINTSRYSMYLKRFMDVFLDSSKNDLQNMPNENVEGYGVERFDLNTDNVNKQDPLNDNFDSHSDELKPIIVKIEDDENFRKIDEKLINNLRKISDEEKYQEIARSLIKQFGDITAVSKLISLICDRQNQEINENQIATYVNQVSTLSGRKGYTAYRFLAHDKMIDENYFIHCLKRLNGEEILEKVDNFRPAKDQNSFVFELPSEFDEVFQTRWKDKDIASVSLFEGDIGDSNKICVPELDNEEIIPSTLDTLSKYTGRKGYTAYHFVAHETIRSKAYLFNALRKYIDLTKMVNIAKTKDQMGFVFDFPSQYDQILQECGRLLNPARLVMLEDVPELLEQTFSRFSNSNDCRSTVSNLTKRKGYTAYQFVSTSTKFINEDYLYDSLVVYIDQNILSFVEMIEKLKYKNGFVFDLPSEFNKVIKDNWRDSNCNSLSLLEREVPNMVLFPSRNSTTDERNKYYEREKCNYSERKRINSSHYERPSKLQKFN